MPSPRVWLNRTLAAASDLLTTRTGQLTIQRARAKGLGAAGAEFVQEAVAHPSACPCAADGLPVAVEETPSVARAAEEEYMNVSVQLTNQEYLDEVMRCTGPIEPTYSPSSIASNIEPTCSLKRL